MRFGSVYQPTRVPESIKQIVLAENVKVSIAKSLSSFHLHFVMIFKSQSQNQVG